MRRLRMITLLMIVASLLVAASAPMLLPESTGSRQNADFTVQAAVTLTGRCYGWPWRCCGMPVDVLVGMAGLA